MDLVLDKDITLSTKLGGVSTVLNCVGLAPGIGDLAEEGNRIVKTAEFAAKAAGWGACAADAGDFIDALNGALSGEMDDEKISKSIEALGGCVGDLLGDMFKEEATE